MGEPPVRQFVLVVPDGSGDHRERFREILPEVPQPTPPHRQDHPWGLPHGAPPQVVEPQEAEGPDAPQIGNEILEPAENPPQDGAGPAAEGGEAPQEDEGILDDEFEMEDPEDNQEEMPPVGP